MSYDTDGQTGGTTFYGQVRELRESGASAEAAFQQLQAAGMEADRARDLIKTVYGASYRATTAPRARTTRTSEPSPAFGRAIGAGFGTAILGAIIWGAIAAAVRMNFGIVAWGIGAAVGYAVYQATPEEYRTEGYLPWIACGLAFLGILAGQYLTFIFIASQTAPDKVSLADAFSPNVMLFYINNMLDFVSPISFLWIALAIWSAYKISSQDQ